MAIVARYNSNPTTHNYTDFKKIIRHLKGTIDEEMVTNPEFNNFLQLKAHGDPDFAGSYTEQTLRDLSVLWVLKWLHLILSLKL